MHQHTPQHHNTASKERKRPHAHNTPTTTTITKDGKEAEGIGSALGKQGAEGNQHPLLNFAVQRLSVRTTPRLSIVAVVIVVCFFEGGLERTHPKYRDRTATAVARVIGFDTRARSSLFERGVCPHSFGFVPPAHTRTEAA